MTDRPEGARREPLWIYVATWIGGVFAVVGFIAAFFDATKYSLGALFPVGAGFFAIAAYAAERRERTR